MTKKDIIAKLTSRKFWIAIAGVATGVCMALGVEASDVQAVAGAVTAIVSAITYIYTEGKIDAARISKAVESTEAAIKTISEK